MKKVIFDFKKSFVDPTIYVHFDIKRENGSTASVKIPGGHDDNIAVYQNESSYFFMVFGLFYVAPLKYVKAYRLHACFTRPNMSFSEIALVAEKYIVLENCHDIVVIDNEKNYRKAEIF